MRKKASESLHRRLTAEPKNVKEGRKRTKCYKWVGAMEDGGVGKVFLPSVYFPSFLLQAFLMFIKVGGTKSRRRHVLRSKSAMLELQTLAGKILGKGVGKYSWKVSPMVSIHQSFCRKGPRPLLGSSVCS